MTKLKYIWCLLLPLHALAQNLKVTELKCDYRVNPAGVESVSPRLSWQLQNSQRNTLQAAYRILVADDSLLLAKNNGNVWDSRKLNSSASIQIAFEGKALSSAKTYYWKVMVWDNHGNQSAWSKTNHWQMGLLKAADWKNAKWIAYDQMPDSEYRVPFIHGKGPKKLGQVNDVLPLFRRQISVNKSVRKATIFISGLGHFELSMNGHKIGDHFLDPGWTKYDKQALYVPFDVTKELKQGANTIGVMLGNGFYYIPRDKRYRKLTGAYGHPKMICRMKIEYTDGSEDNMISDESWKTAPGPITFTSIYAGEDYNANLEQEGWNTNNFNDAHWQNPIVINQPVQLNAQTAEPLKVMQTFEPVKVSKLAANKWIYDLGQNASGIPYIRVKGKKGDTIKITPSELINADGSANQKGSGGPAYFIYVLKGSGTEEWQPRFTYYGFRYLQVEGGIPHNEANDGNLPVLLSVKGLHTRNSAYSNGDFSSSNELFNKTFKLIDWAMKSNMASVFTDCPHREKLGWLEEAHLIGGALRYSYDISGLARKCISDMQIAQTPEGLIPEIAPEFVHFESPFLDSPEWGSNGIILPWYVYQWYGNKEVLAQSYPMMKKYLAYLRTKEKDHILMQGLGDWYDLGPKPPGLSQNTPQGLTATAMYYYALNIATDIAKLLGKPQDAAGYQAIAKEVRQAFNKTFFDSQTKQYGTGSQTANAVAVYMKLVGPQYKDAVVENIVKDIRNRGNSLTAGDIGYPYLLRVLSQENSGDVIYDMNSRSDVPGYGYQLAKGATALTESWQALPTVSNNHFMLGDLTEWFYNGLAGIRQPAGAVAFKQIEIRPQVVGDVTSAKASYRSPYGEIVSSWKKNKDGFELDIEIPPNTTATVSLPKFGKGGLNEGGHHIAARTNRDRLLTTVGSGFYHFIVK